MEKPRHVDEVMEIVQQNVEMHRFDSETIVHMVWFECRSEKKSFFTRM